MALVGNISGSGGTYSTIGITGSVIFAYTDTPSAFPSLPAVGGDVVFFVSGSTTGKGGTTRNVAVFGGDTVVSGSLTIGSGSVKITSNDIQFSDAATRIERNGNNLKFFDASNTGGLTLSQLNAGGGGSGTNFFLDTAGAGKIYTTASSVAFPFGEAGVTEAANKGTDVVFYVSGSGAGTRSALFGGNIVASGSATVKSDLRLDANIVATVDTSRSIFTAVTNGNTITIGGANSQTSLGGDLTVSGNDISGSAGLNLTLGAAGAVTVAGDLTVNGNIVADANEAKSIFTAVTSNTITIGGAGSTVAADTLSVGGGYGSSGVTISSAGNIQANGSLTVDGTSTLTGNVTVTGDLTVNGTTTTIDATTVSIQDPVIGLGFSSGSAGRVTPGDRGLLLAGTGVTNYGLIWNNTPATFAAITTDQSTTSSLPVNITDYRPFRASKFTLGTSFLTSSNGTDLDLYWGSSPTNYLRLTNDGTAAQLINPSTDGVIIASGSRLDLRHSLEKGSVAFYNETSHGLGVVIRGTGGSVNSTIVSRLNTTDGSAALPLAVSGSALVLGDQSFTAFERLGSEYLRVGSNVANTITSVASPANRTLTMGAAGSGGLNLSGSSVAINVATTNAVTLQRDGTAVAAFSAATTTTPIFKASQSNATFVVGTGGGTSDIMVLSGTAIQFNASLAGQSFRRDGTEFLLISSGASGPNQRSLITAAAGKTFVIGGTSETILSGSSLTLLSGFSGSPSGVDFSTDASGLTQSYLNITSGSYVTPAGTASTNAAKIVPGDLPNPHDVLVGASSGKNLFLSGSSVRINAGAGGTALQLNGSGFIQFTSGTTGQNDVTVTTPTSTRVDLFNATATTVNFAGAGTAIAIGALGTGATYLKNNALFISGTTTVGASILPSADMQYDLGAPGTRFRNMYTGDLHLRNDRGNWTIIEEADYLSITNNKNGKRYKFVLQEI